MGSGSRLDQLTQNPPGMEGRQGEFATASHMILTWLCARQPLESMRSKAVTLEARAAHKSPGLSTRQNPKDLRGTQRSALLTDFPGDSDAGSPWTTY